MKSFVEKFNFNLKFWFKWEKSYLKVLLKKFSETLNVLAWMESITSCDDSFTRAFSKILWRNSKAALQKLLQWKIKIFSEIFSISPSKLTCFSAFLSQLRVYELGNSSTGSFRMLTNDFRRMFIGNHLSRELWEIRQCRNFSFIYKTLLSAQLIIKVLSKNFML